MHQPYFLKCSKCVTLVALLFSVQSFAQTQKARIYGQVTDSNRQSIPGAHVRLISLDAQQERQTMVSTEDGGFAFESVGQGRYVLSASMVGYVAGHADTVVVAAEVSMTIQRNLVLTEAAVELNAATVTARRQAIEMDHGKLVLNVGNSALSSGASALDLLRKVPGVSLGQDDQILLKGAGGVNVMIDGKMTYLSEQQLAQLLKSISGESISKVELMPTPGAEFDAAGNAGIINFVTRKNLSSGYSLDFLTSISKGRFWMNNQNVAGSYRNSKLNAFASFDYNTPHRFVKSRSGNSVTENGQRIYIDRQLETPTKIYFYTFRANVEWQIAAAHQLTAGYNGYIDDYVKDNALSRVSKYNARQELTGVVNSTNYLEEPYHYDAANAGYQFNIDSAGKKLTADAHYISYRNFSDGLLTTGYTNAAGHPDGPDEQLRVHQPGTVAIRSIKADLDLPFERVNVKAGVKYADIRNQANYRFDSLLNGGFVEAKSMSNRFRYREQIAAAYTSLSGKSGKTRWEAGLRLEWTRARGYTLETGIDNRWQYIRLFPSFSAEHLLNANNKFNLSISRRINRPAYSTLNPVRWYYDQYFYFSGNPYLQPEMAWSYSAGYTLKDNYVLSASYSTRSNFLSRRLGIEEGTGAVISQHANLGRMRRLDVTGNAGFHPFSFWDLQLTAAASHTSYPIPLLEGERVAGMWAAHTMLTQQFKLSAGIHIELAGAWTSRELLGIYQKRRIFVADFGMKKTFAKGKLDVRISVNDFLRTNRYQGRSLTDYTNYRYNELPDTRRAALSLKYHLGGQLQQGRSRRIEEQDRL
nr:outer membrane beta-barrel protein [uncultured Dyadobacter sp.]